MSDREPSDRWRLAVLSDPHGDHVAFSKVIGHLEGGAPVDEVLIGGDIAQGGAEPGKVIDEIRRRGWRSVRGNADDLLVRIADGMAAEDALRFGEHTHGPPRPEVARRSEWSVRRLSPDQIEYLRALPLAIERPFPIGKVTLVHATPWSTEDVVLPEDHEELAERMVSTAEATLVLYGHIHTPYQRRLGHGAIASVGAVSGSNDADPRPAYTVVSIGSSITIEVRRVDWPIEERLAAYAAAGVERRFSRDSPGPMPVHSEAGAVVTVWP